MCRMFPDEPSLLLSVSFRLPPDKVAHARVRYGDVQPRRRLLAGDAPSSSPPSSSASAANGRNVPWPKPSTRSYNDIMQAITEKKITVHSSRQRVTARHLQVILNNVQRSLSLTVRRDGGWNEEADSKLLRTLAAPKKNPQAKLKAIKDAERPMALKDASPNAMIDDTDANGQDPIPMEMEHYMEPSAEATEPNHDPHHIAAEMQPPTPSGSASSPSSSSASSSSQSTPKAELRRRIMELEANLSEAPQDLCQANEALGLNR